MSQAYRVLRRVLSAMAVVLGVAFLVGPILLVVWIGLSDAQTISMSAGAITPHSITAFLADPAWSDALRRSVLLAAMVAVLALAMGSLAAFVNVRQRNGRIFSAALMILPSVVPTVVYALGLILVSGRVDVDPLYLLALGHTVIATPFAFLVMRVGLQALRPDLVESARLLGASPLTTFVRVVVPPLVPFALVSAVLAGSVSLAEPVMAIFLLNDSSATLPQKSFQGLRFSFDPSIMTAATVIILITLVVAVPSGMLMYRRDRHR